MTCNNSHESIYGLIGHPLKHSFSPSFFNAKFKEENIDARYELFDIEELSEIKKIIDSTPNLNGLNVTIPYKENVIKYLDEIDETAKIIGAVNFIKINDGKLLGFNTDAFGFEKTLLKYLSNQSKNAVVLGNGGSAKAVRFVLEKNKIEYQIICRTPKNKDELSFNDLNVINWKDYTFVINTTPLGMFPEVDLFPPINYDQINQEHVLIDLIYNPETTRFLELGKSNGARIQNGLEMLVAQAEKSWEIWNS